MILGFGAFAQESASPQGEVSDVDASTKGEAKVKVQRDFKPSGVNVGLEGLGLARTMASTGFNQFEVQSDIDFHRYFFVLDVGHEKNSFSNDEFSYSNRGNYFRTGIQINMMPYNPNKNFFFFGFRYARSNFSDELSYADNFEKWGENTLSLKNASNSARWFEINMGLKVKVFKRVYFGYTIRYKLGKKLSGFDKLTPKIIPGYGRANKGSNAGFNYYFLYHIPLRDKPVPPRLKKKYKDRPVRSTGSSSFQRPF